jgi:hypothetical protein
VDVAQTLAHVEFRYVPRLSFHTGAVGDGERGSVVVYDTRE